MNQSQDYKNQELLAVFQASPLATINKNDGTMLPIDRLDFEHERESLVRVFNESGARINVEFEVATTENLGHFLAKGKGKNLHFSCHGCPEYLAVDDGWGQMQPLEASRLREWISICGHRLKFVFVSACHSEDIGQAFIDAGVPHVICCSGRVLTEAAVEFEKAFYRALANGLDLLEAFKLARQQLMVCPTLEEGVRQDQAQRFCLLPSRPADDSHHKMKIFSAESIPSESAPWDTTRQNVPRAASFPPAPELFLGRDLDIFRILQALRDGTRLVNISGHNGVGKSALVKACCRYISNRLHIMNIDEIIWLPFDQNDQEESESVVKCWLEELFDRMQDDTPVWIFQNDCGYRIRQIMQYLQDRRPLIVIEAKNLLPQGMTKLASFLQNLFLHARYIKVIVVHRDGSDVKEISAREIKCIQANLEIAPLSFDHTLALFGLMCPHVTGKTVETIRSSKQLSDVLRSRYEQEGESRKASIFKLLGEGAPEDIYRSAKHMTPETYQKLIHVAGDCEEKEEANDKFETRAALLRRRDELSRKIDLAATEGNFRLADECQTVLNHIESQKRDHCDLFVLKHKLENASYQLKEAKSGKEWSSADDLQSEVERMRETLYSEREALFDFMKDKIKGLRNKMEQARSREDPLRAHQFELELEYVQTNWQVEQDAFIAFGIVESEDETTEVFRTRRCIVAKIEDLTHKLGKACDVNDFDKAEEMHTELSRLEVLRGLRPSKRELISSISQLEAKLSQAKTSHEWDKAKVVHGRLEEMKAKFESEESAEEKWGKSEEESESFIEQDLHFSPMGKDTGVCAGETSEDKNSGDSGKASSCANSDAPKRMNSKVAFATTSSRPPRSNLSENVAHGAVAINGRQSTYRSPPSYIGSPPGEEDALDISTVGSTRSSQLSENVEHSPVATITGARALSMNGRQSTYRSPPTYMGGSPPGEEDALDISTVGSFRTLGTRGTRSSTVVAREVDAHSPMNPLQGEVVGLEEEQRIQRIVEATIQSIGVHAELVEPIPPRRKSSLRRHFDSLVGGRRRKDREKAILVEQFFGHQG